MGQKNRLANVRAKCLETKPFLLGFYPFMVCISVSATMNLINSISQNLDAEVFLWSDALKQNIKVGYS